jgi:hypothetical protein
MLLWWLNRNLVVHRCDEFCYGAQPENYRWWIFLCHHRHRIPMADLCLRVTYPVTAINIFSSRVEWHLRAINCCYRRYSTKSRSPNPPLPLLRPIGRDVSILRQVVLSLFSCCVAAPLRWAYFDVLLRTFAQYWSPISACFQFEMLKRRSSARGSSCLNAVLRLANRIPCLKVQWRAEWVGTYKALTR